MNISQFRKTVLKYYCTHGRDFPWRKTKNAYRILVSEVMLQQTQAARVASKYGEFLRAFPTIQALHRAPLRTVLRVWQGLGYNRRAAYLKYAAEKIVKRHGGRVPKTIEKLVKLPGIGHATAAAIVVYAYNAPLPFIETNIRTVFIYHFFPHQMNVSDKKIFTLVAKALDWKNPRVWYWALMDYGSHIKKVHGNVSRQSAGYLKQSTFKGSTRELRGNVIRALLDRQSSTKKEIRHYVGHKVLLKSLSLVLEHLQQDGFVILRNKRYSIPTI